MGGSVLVCCGGCISLPGGSVLVWGGSRAGRWGALFMGSFRQRTACPGDSQQCREPRREPRRNTCQRLRWKTLCFQLSKTSRTDRPGKRIHEQVWPRTRLLKEQRTPAAPPWGVPAERTGAGALPARPQGPLLRGLAWHPWRQEAGPAWGGSAGRRAGLQLAGCTHSGASVLSERTGW